MQGASLRPGSRASPCAPALGWPLEVPCILEAVGELLSMRSRSSFRLWFSSVSS